MTAMTDQPATLRTAAEITLPAQAAGFSAFDPRTDADAAAKFALAAIGRGRARQLPDLAELMTEQSWLGGIEGEPGWSLERRDDGDTMPGYATWPDGAKYRAYVDPQAYVLPQPEVFYDRAGFHRLVASMLAEFEARNPDQAEMAGTVRAAL